MEESVKNSANVHQNVLVNCFMKLNWLYKLFFISLGFLFVAIATNFKRHLALDLTGFLAIVCLMQGRVNYKTIIKIALPLICLSLYACIKPCVNNEYFNFGIRALGAFFIGLAAEFYLADCWLGLASLSPLSITIVLIAYWLGIFCPSDVMFEGRLALTMHPAPGIMAFVAFWAFMQGVYAIIKAKSNIRYLLIASCLGCLVVIALAASQAAIFGLACCLFYFVCWFVKRYRKKAIIAALTMIVLLAVLLGGYGEKLLIVKRIYTSLTNKDIFLRMSARTPIWLTVIDLFKKHPVLGTSDSYSEMLSYVQDPVMQERFHYKGGVYPEDSPHNILLSMLHYYGLIGLFLFVWLMVSNIKYAYKYSKYYFMPFIIFELTAGMLDYHWLTTHGIFFYFFAMGNTYAIGYKKELKGNSNL